MINHTFEIFLSIADFSFRNFIIETCYAIVSNVSCVIKPVLVLFHEILHNLIVIRKKLNAKIITFVVIAFFFCL